MQKRLLIRAAGAALALALVAPAHAQATNYPDHPIRIVVPYPPGGFNDTLARTVGAKLQAAWGQPVVVENRPGGATNIGIDAVAKAPADGHTLVVIPFSFAVNPFLFAKLPFDPQKDFAPITLAATTANLLVVPASSPVNTVQELIALAKSRPGTLNYASTGTGSSNHLSMELFKQMAGVDITHVPYKGSAPAVADLIGGHIGTMFDNISNVLQHVQSGKLKVLGVTTPARSALVPGVPTVAESGVAGYEVGVWFGFAAPAGTPKPIIDKLNAEIVKILHMPDVKEKFTLQGVESVGSTPAAFVTHMQAQRVVWSKVVKDANVKVE